MTCNHLMLDFESLGLLATAPIVRVAAVYFDPKNGREGRNIDIKINLKHSVQDGAEIEPDTMLWWFKQDPAVFNQVFVEDHGLLPAVAFDHLNDFVSGADFIWCHPLDVKFMEEKLYRYRIEPSVPYNKYRELRTLMHLAGLSTQDLPPVGDAHDPLDDCRFQIQYCVAALKKLGVEL